MITHDAVAILLENFDSFLVHIGIIMWLIIALVAAHIMFGSRNNG